MVGAFVVVGPAVVVASAKKFIEDILVRFCESMAMLHDSCTYAWLEH